MSDSEKVEPLDRPKDGDDSTTLAWAFKRLEARRIRGIYNTAEERAAAMRGNVTVPR